jgi:ferric-dicitrate binding protein FerR (iron transport regulator)
VRGGKEVDSGRWLADAVDPGRRALRQALDDADPQRDSALAKQRIWNRVQFPWVDQPRSPWRGVLLLGAGAAAALGVVGALVLTGVLRQSEPVVSSRVPARPSRPELVPLPSAGAVAVTTGPGQRVRHRLPRGVDAELAPRTALVPGDEAAAPEVRVGRVRFSVPHQEHRYTVRAGQYQVAVLGTTFVVAVEDQGVTVSVESGVVQVEDGSGRTLDRLEPGERWSSEPAAPPIPHAPTPRRIAPPADPAAASALEEARAARARDPRRALVLYERLAASNGPLAETALYEMAVIQDDQLHDGRGALATWERYRTRYPAGLLRAEADVSIVEMLLKSGDRDRALDEAVSFLRRYPTSERRAQIAWIAGDLARRGGDCRRAVGLYESALKDRLSGADADHAAFQRAACLTALRDGRAADALRQYLARSPAGSHAVEARRLLENGASGR